MLVISTGYASLDSALGCGGYPCGRIIELYGPAKSGKTTLALRAIAECQGAGGMAALIDAEHDLDMAHVAAMGVAPDKLLVSQPESAEQGLEIIETLARSGAVDLIVVDSVAGLVPRAAMTLDDEQRVGLQTRLIGEALRKLAAVVARTGTCVMFLTRMGMRVGVTFGDATAVVGSNALKFYSAVRIDVRALEVGRTRAKVVKNKLAAPFGEAEIVLHASR